MTSMVLFTSSFMKGKSSSSAFRRSVSVLETIIRPQQEQGPVSALSVEHVLKTEQANSLGAELARLLRVLGSVRVCAHAKLFHLVAGAMNAKKSGSHPRP